MEKIGIPHHQHKQNRLFQENGLPFAEKIRNILNKNSLIFASMLSVSPLSLAQSYNVTAIPLHSLDTTKHNLLEYSKKNGFYFSEDVVDNILGSLVTITNKVGTRTGIMVTPNKLLTSKHGASSKGEERSMTKTLSGKAISPVGTHLVGLMVHPTYDLSGMDFGEGVNKEYYKYLRNSGYSGKVMFVGVVNGEIQVSSGKADNCNEVMNKHNLPPEDKKYILGKLKEIMPYTECASGKAIAGMSGGMVLDDKGNLYGIIVAGDANNIEYTLYHPLTSLSRDPSIHKIERK